MQEYITFIFNHWILASIFVALLIIYVVVEMFYKTNIRIISPQQVVALINHEGGVVIDIRSHEAFIKGHIVGSINIVGADIQPAATRQTDKLAGSKPEWFKKIQRYTDKPIIITCSTGRDAGKVVTNLTTHGFKNVVQMAGGIENWVALGLPLTK